MSLFIKNNSFYYVPKGIAKFILLFISRIKALMPLNLTRINKKYLFDLLDSHLRASWNFWKAFNTNKLIQAWGYRNIEDFYKSDSWYFCRAIWYKLSLTHLARATIWKPVFIGVRGREEYLCQYIGYLA